MFQDQKNVADEAENSIHHLAVFPEHRRQRVKDLIDQPVSIDDKNSFSFHCAFHPVHFQFLYEYRVCLLSFPLHFYVFWHSSKNSSFNGFIDKISKKLKKFGL